MIVDCERCPVRGVSCENCVINVLFAPGPMAVDESPAASRPVPVRALGRERSRQEALRQLHSAGLVRPLWAVPETADGPEKHAG